MAEQKGSLKNRLLTNRIIQANLKKKKDNETEFDKEKRQKELKDLSKMIYFMKPTPITIINPNKVSNINDNEDFKQGNITKALTSAIIINKDTKIIEDEKVKDEVTYITETQITSLKKQIDKQIVEEKKENSITNKVNIIIKQAKKAIEEVKTELIILEEDIKQEYDTKEINKKQKKFEDLKQKIRVLYEKYQILIENVNFSDFYRINDEFLLDEISNYKFVTEENEKIEALARSCKREIHVLEEIVQICESKNKMEDQIEDKKETLTVRDNKFDKYERHVKYQEEINYKLKNIANDYENELKSIESKYKDLNDRHYIELKKLGFLTTNLLKLSVLMMGIKNKNVAMILSTLLIDKMLVKTNEDRKKQYLSDLYSGRMETDQKLDKLSYNLDDVTNSISKNIYEVEDLYEYFNKEFKNYESVIPEYAKTKEQIETILKLLKSKNKEINDRKETLKQIKKENQIKIKKLEGLYD